MLICDSWTLLVSGVMVSARCSWWFGEKVEGVDLLWMGKVVGGVIVVGGYRRGGEMLVGWWWVLGEGDAGILSLRKWSIPTGREAVLVPV